MATCNQSIVDIITNNSVVPIFGATESFSINFDTPKLFSLRLATYSNISIRIITNRAPSAVMYIYDHTGKLIGNSPIHNSVLTLRLSYPRGMYYLCFSTNSFVDVVFNTTMTIVEHEEDVNLSANNYYGQRVHAVLKKQKRPPIDLDLPVDMEIIEGNLPSGLDMTIRGEIYGIINELDCMEDTEDGSPSFDYYNDIGDYVTMSWGKLWRFKVKAWLDFSPETKPIEEWFCIKVFNDWSRDRDDFIEMIELMDDIYEYKYVYKTLDDIKLPDGLCITRCEDIDSIISPPILGVELKSNCPLNDDEEFTVVIGSSIDRIIVPPSALDYVLAGYNDEKLIKNSRRFKAYLLDTPNINVDCDSFILRVRSSDILTRMVEFQNMTEIRQSDTKKDYYINFNEESQNIEFAEFDKIPEFKQQTNEFSDFDPMGTLDIETTHDLWDKLRLENKKKNNFHVYTWFGSSSEIK